MKKNHQVALGLSLLLIVWMMLGQFRQVDPQMQNDTVDQSDPTLSEMTVEATAHTAQYVDSYIFAQGNLTPDRDVIVRAQTSGQIKAITAKEGDPIDDQALLATLKLEDRRIQLDRAEAQLTWEQGRYESLKELRGKGFTAQTRLDEAYAGMKEAQATKEEILLDMSYTEIRAPFAGAIDMQMVEKGDVIHVGDPLFSIVDNDPLVVTVHIPQNDIHAIPRHAQAMVSLADGVQRYGSMRYIAPRAHPETRSFRVEYDIPNPDNLPSGTSVYVRIPKERVLAHFFSPALLSLDSNGNMGVKTVNQAGVVDFHLIDIISSQQAGIYVTGLPNEVRLITQGQGFVRPGDKVKVIEKQQASDQEAGHSIVENDDKAGDAHELY